MAMMKAALGLVVCSVLTFACARKSQTEPGGSEPVSSSASAARAAPVNLESAKLGAPAPDGSLRLQREVPDVIIEAARRME